MKKELSIWKLLGFVASLTFTTTFLLWLPFLLRLNTFWTIPIPTDGLASIVANYDGPLYIVVAKTFYNASAIMSNYSFDLSVEYYAAHFPLYPLLIRGVAQITGNFLHAMLIVTVLSSVGSLYYFYRFIRGYVTVNQALWMTVVFSILPARWLVVRSVGSPEPLFIACLIASIYYFQNKKYWLAGIAGALAQLTKSPGILLFIAYGMTLALQSFKQLAIKKNGKLEHYINWRAYPVLLIPLALLGLFFYYGNVFNDFFAYFNSGDNIHLFFPPFQIFNYSAPWVGTFWLEEIIFVYFFGILGLLKLFELYKEAPSNEKEKNAVVMWFAAIFLFSIFFVSHRDIVRYSLPIVPFIFAGWKKFFNAPDFKIAFLIVVIPIYLYSIAFVAQNVMPIGDWAPFL